VNKKERQAKESAIWEAYWEAYGKAVAPARKTRDAALKKLEKEAVK